MSTSVRAEVIKLLPPPPAAVARLPHIAGILDALHPELRIDTVVVRGTTFSPAAVAWLSAHTGVPLNMMFMRTPRLAFPFQVAAFGGVRIALDQRFEPIREAAEAHALSSIEHLGATLRLAGGQAPAAESPDDASTTRDRAAAGPPVSRRGSLSP